MGRKLMSRGFGESRVTPTAPLEEFDEVSSGIPPREEWTVGGNPLSEHPAQHMITWEMTDQAIEIRVKEQLERERERGGRLSVGASEEDKNFAHRKDRFDKYGTPEATESLDHKTVLRKQHAVPGHVHMYVPLNELDRYRGLDGFEPVKDENGNPVMYLDNVLTSRPKEVQEKVDRQDSYEAERNMNAAVGEARESMKKQLRDLNLSPAHIDADDFGLRDDNTSAVFSS